MFAPFGQLEILGQIARVVMRRFAFRDICRFKNRRSIRLERDAIGHVFALVSPDQSLDISLINLGGAAGHVGYSQYWRGKFRS